MPQTIDMPIPHGRPGTSRSIRVHRFGAEGAAPHVHIQAGLHAGEIPGLLVAQHLIRRLSDLEQAGEIIGTVTLVPVANPIGLDQVLHGRLLGRFELGGGVNFNRAYPDLADGVAARLDGRLGSDAEANAALIRDAARAEIAALPVDTEAEGMKRILLSLAIKADVLLDLHCDSEALMHLYTAPSLWPGFRDLADRLGCRAAFLAEESGGDPFDEACSGLWWRLRKKLGDTHPIPDGCAATTVELRGEADVDDTMAAGDAMAIIDHLKVRGVIAGTPAALPSARCDATPLAGVDRVKAPAAGVIAFHVPLGATVEAGQLVAEIVDPWSGGRHPCYAGAAGLVWSRSLERFAHPGDQIIAIAGREARAGGNLLTA